VLWLAQLTEELSISFRDENLWRAAGTGLVFDAIILVVGLLTARFVGFVPKRASAGEMLGVGLSAGLVLSAAWTAVLGSNSRSAFLPVALGLAVALVLAGNQRIRPGKPVNVEEGHHQPALSQGTLTVRSAAVAAIGSIGFLLGAALLYGATLAPSPRDGVQPIDFQDGAF